MHSHDLPYAPTDAHLNPATRTPRLTSYPCGLNTHYVNHLHPPNKPARIRLNPWLFSKAIVAGFGNSQGQHKDAPGTPSCLVLSPECPGRPRQRGSLARAGGCGPRRYHRFHGTDPRPGSRRSPHLLHSPYGYSADLRTILRSSAATGCLTYDRSPTRSVQLHFCTLRMIWAW